MVLLQSGSAGGTSADSIAPIHVLPPLVDDIGSQILAYAVLLAAIATIVMALLELIKGVLRVRMRFHYWHLRRWVRDRGGAPGKVWHHDLRSRDVDPPALIQLKKLCSAQGEDIVAILELPTDEMVRHLRGAAGVAIDFPDRFPDLSRFLMDLTPNVATEWNRLSSVPRGESHDGHDRPLDLDGNDDQVASNGEWSAAAIRARARIDHFVTRRLDAFQAHLEYWWARWNQYSAVGGGTLFIAGVLGLSGGAPWGGARVFQTLVLAAFGGMLAPFAKDVVSALINLRAKVD